LRDAAQYITVLLQADHDAAEWQAAMEALLLVVDQNGPTMFARIAMMQAPHRQKPEPTPAPRRTCVQQNNGDLMLPSQKSPGRCRGFCVTKLAEISTWQPPDHPN
jgi:hypothetical protein